MTHRKDGHDARTVADWFIAREPDSMTIMKLLKLVYIAHGWHLECTGGKPLIRNDIQAWPYGPVIPDVYYAYRQEGLRDITVKRNARFNAEQAKFDDGERKIMADVYSAYGDFGAFALSNITHVKDGPWDSVYKEKGQFASIGNDIIEKHYRSIREEIENAEGNA